MLLQHTHLKPNVDRAPYFDGWETVKATYQCQCAECQVQIAIPFSEVHASAWSWRERFSMSEVESIESFFPETKKSDQRSKKSWSSVTAVTCGACNADYIFYAEVDEYRNSVFQLFAQGLARRIN
jgi:hypothetical protein